jgi:polyphosphate kinase 2 (PPK2 family)
MVFLKNKNCIQKYHASVPFQETFVMFSPSIYNKCLKKKYFETDILGWD